MANIKVTDLELVALWNYNSKNKECLCKRSLHIPPVTQVEKKNLYRHNITFGKCNHAFHSDCINSYLKTYNTCPFDGLEFTRCDNNYKIKYNVAE